MTQYNYGKDPETGREFTIYQRNDAFGQYSIARRNADASSYQYLTESYGWIPKAEGGIVRKTKEECEAIVRDYTDKLLRESIIPVLIDTTRLRVAFKCPQCGLVHKTQIKSDSWGLTNQVMRRGCPKIGKDFTVKLWEMKMKRVVATCATGDIDPLPKWECKECFGSGEYTGLGLVDTRSLCFPKSVPYDGSRTSFP